MDLATSKSSGERLDHDDKGVCENLSHLVEGVGTDAVAGHSLGDRVSVCGEIGTSEGMCNDIILGLNEDLKCQIIGGDARKIDDELCGIGQGTSYNSINPVNAETFETRVGQGTSCNSINPVNAETFETRVGQGTSYNSINPVNVETFETRVGQGTSYNSINPVNAETFETRVVINSSAHVESVNSDNRKLENKTNESTLSKLSIKAPKGVSETDKNSCVIDMNCGTCRDFSDNLDDEMICRICHLTSEQPLEAAAVGTSKSANNSTGLIMLGCACKDELGIAHSHCAEAWFKIKGNRSCEICGEIAKNVSDVSDDGLMEEWIESGFNDNGSASPQRSVGCWRGQPFCNFLMTCLVIAFILPWFFRVKMF